MLANAGKKTNYIAKIDTGKGLPVSRFRHGSVSGDGDGVGVGGDDEKATSTSRHNPRHCHLEREGAADEGRPKRGGDNREGARRRVLEGCCRKMARSSANRNRIQ